VIIQVSLAHRVLCASAHLRKSTFDHSGGDHLSLLVGRAGAVPGDHLVQLWIDAPNGCHCTRVCVHARTRPLRVWARSTWPSILHGHIGRSLGRKRVCGGYAYLAF
jgi:hypothetical protein